MASVPLLVLDNHSADAQRDSTAVETGASEPTPSTTTIEPASPGVPAVVLADADALVDRAAQWSVAYASAAEDRLRDAVELGEQVQALNAFVTEQAAEAERAAEQVRLDAEAAAAAAAAADAPAPTTPPTTSPPTTSPPATTTAPSPPPTTTAVPEVAPAPTGGPTAEEWAALRQCEASGNYGAVNSTGKYRGAYQFSQATWDWIASAYYPHLVGVSPEQASPADQDAMALALYNQQGPRGAWPNCSSVFS